MTLEQWTQQTAVMLADLKDAEEQIITAKARRDARRTATVLFIEDARRMCATHILRQWNPDGETVTLLDGTRAKVLSKTAREYRVGVPALTSYPPLDRDPLTLHRSEIAYLNISRRSGRVIQAANTATKVLRHGLSIGDQVLEPDPSVK